LAAAASKETSHGSAAAHVKSGQLKLYRQWELEDWIDREIGLGGRNQRPSRVRLRDAHDQFIEDCKAGVALTKRGRPYKPKAITNLDSSLRRLPDGIRHEPLGTLGRGEIQEAVGDFRREGLSSSRISSIVNALRSLYRWAINREMALEDPASSPRRRTDHPAPLHPRSPW
jgi:hypothetical protein